MTAYPYAERDKAYDLIKKTADLADIVEQIGLGQRENDPDLQAAIANMTGASDLHQQHKALQFLRDSVSKSHRRKIIAAAKDDFTCFVEAVNPDEPCRAAVHRFLGERLMYMDANPGTRAAISMPPGHAKDLCVETPVLMGDGTSKRLGDIEIGDFVITHTGNAREVVEVHDQGKRETITLHTITGRKIRTHPDHPFLTPAGWIPAKELVKGDVVAQQREFGIGNTSGRTRAEFALAGYMMAYGMVRGRAYSRINEIDNRFRTDDPLIIDDVLELARTLGYDGKVHNGRSYNEEVRTIHFEETFRYWLETQQLWGLKRRTMRIPEWVYKGSYEDIGAFLGAIFSMDANLVPRRNKHTGAQRQLQIRLRNVGLSKDLRRLLIRVGARAAYTMGLHKCYNYEPVDFHTITIWEDEDIAFLRKALRIVGTNRRFWDQPIPVRRFFDARYAEDKIIDIREEDSTETRCLTVEIDHSFLADGIVVHNSTYCSRLFPAWWLGRRENKKWLQGGHTQRFAEKEFGKKLRDEIINTDGYREVFDVVERSGSVDEIILSNKCSYVVKGVGQGISGYRSHFNNIDDPYPTEKAAQSPVTRDTVWDWFTNDFRTRRLPGAGELIIVTRWHSDDIVGRLEEGIKSGEIDPWEIINLPAFSLGPDLDQLGRKKGEPLWPEFFTEAFLLDIKGPMNENRWESLYQGSPVLSEGNILKRKWLKYYDYIPISRRGTGDPANRAQARANQSFENRPWGPSESRVGPQESAQKTQIRRMRVVISVDSAEKETVRSDFSSIQAWALGEDKKHYLLDVVRDKFDFPKLVTQIENMAKKWEADIILCETKGAGNQYVQSRHDKAPCSVIGYNPGRDSKEIRFDGTMTDWQAGNVLLPSRAPWLATYIDELLRFPAGKHDDSVDATSQYLNWSRDDGGWRRGTKRLSS